MTKSRKTKQGQRHDPTIGQKKQFEDAVEKIITEHIKWQSIVISRPDWTPREVKDKYRKLNKTLKDLQYRLGEWHKFYRFHTWFELSRQTSENEDPHAFIKRLSEDVLRLSVVVDRVRSSDIMPSGKQQRIKPEIRLTMEMARAYLKAVGKIASKDKDSYFHGMIVAAFLECKYVDESDLPNIVLTSKIKTALDNIDVEDAEYTS